MNVLAPLSLTRFDLRCLQAGYLSLQPAEADALLRRVRLAPRRSWRALACQIFGHRPLDVAACMSDDYDVCLDPVVCASFTFCRRCLEYWYRHVEGYDEAQVDSIPALDETERLVLSRKTYSFNHETDGHGCGLSQGASPPCELDDTAQIEALPPGSRFTTWAGAPGTGHTTYRVTRHDSHGAWGVVEEDTVRILSPEEVA